MMRRWVPALVVLLCFSALGHGETLSEPLTRMQFKNSGTVTRDMVFEKVEKNSLYMESEELWFARKYNYLHEVKDGKKIHPPSGMRSSVPLGGLGAGTVELRADGRFVDWNIFNNSPATGKNKVQLNDALLGLRIKPLGGDVVATTLRTHPPKNLPAIQSAQYAGAFPVSRWKYSDDALPVEATLYAYSEFRIRDSKASGTPCALFSLELKNPTDKTVDASFMFNLPNHIKGKFRSENGLVLTQDGADPTGGSVTLAAQGADRVSAGSGDDLSKLWDKFSANGDFADADVKADGAYGAMSASATIKPGQTRVVTIALAWYFPDRMHNSDLIGNQYTNQFSDSIDVAKTVLGRLPKTLAGIETWHQTCFDNTLPEWLQDSLVNSAATMFKTSIWAEDGRYRQYESFSCSNVEPIHITFGRVLLYDFFFPDLKTSIFRTYAQFQREDGYIQEKISARHQGANLDQPPKRGRITGDCCTTFIMAVFQCHKWGSDKEFVDEMWPHVKRAAQWQINRSKEYGLPDHLVSTYDLSAFHTKDAVSYNAFMHLAGLQATIQLAAKYDKEFADVCLREFNQCRPRVEKCFWTGKHFRNLWMKDKPYDDAIHVDTLYGQMWCSLLGLDDCADREQLLSHLEMEKKYCDTPYGLEVINNPAKKRNIKKVTNNNNDTVWQGGSVTWSLVSLLLDKDVDESLSMVEKMMNHWRLTLNDQWDIRDLSTIWDGYPWCNSHYTRQLTFWAIPLAMAGQDYSAPDRTLSFNPRVEGTFVLPFFLPQANGVLDSIADNEFELRLIAGELSLDKVIIGGNVVATDVNLKAGDTLSLSVDNATDAESTGSVVKSSTADALLSGKLKDAKIEDACQKLGLDFEKVFGTLASNDQHPYHRYRWSVTYGENGPIIHAVPPEEETGWTPWERWSLEKGKPVRTDWVQYPVKQPIERGIIAWYPLEQSGDLTPRLALPSKDLESQLRRARIDVAADWLGLDFQKTFLDSISEPMQKKYQEFRWVAIPHVLAANGPVIYALPPEGTSDDWPWHSWYTDGVTPRILHVHYTAKKPETVEETWSENLNAPQRPPEIYEHEWHWYDDLKMLPVALPDRSKK